MYLLTWDDAAFLWNIFVIYPVFVFVTQQNHETLTSLYRDMEMGRYVPNSTGSSWNTRKKEEKELIDHLLVRFADNSQAHHKNKVR